MKSNVAVTNYVWGSGGDDACILDFAVLKKGLLGGMKPDRRFAGWALTFFIQEDNQIDIDTISLIDGNFQTVQDGHFSLRASDYALVNAVLFAGVDTLKNSGEEQKANMVSQARPRFFKKYLVKKTD